MFRINRITLFSACFVLFTIAFSSCIDYKQSLYLNNLPADSKIDTVAITLSKYADPKIRPNDILNVSVQTLDPQGSTMMGTSNASTFLTQGSAGVNQVTGFLVDRNGVIELPLVGKINLGGLTTSEARDLITTQASKYYKEPVVNVRITNFNISILGEVNRPAVYTIANEKVSVLDAIALAGDLTVYAKRDNILLIREENGVKRFVRFDLNSTNIFQSPYFYLQQGDQIIVGAIKSKIVNADAVTNRNITIISTVVTVAVSLITILLYVVK
jgi:polysaccharide export outer membrane protein